MHINVRFENGPVISASPDELRAFETFDDFAFAVALADPQDGSLLLNAETNEPLDDATIDAILEVTLCPF